MQKTARNVCFLSLSFKRFLLLFFGSFFSYCLKSQRMTPLSARSHSPPTWQRCFFPPTSFFLGLLASGFLDLLSFRLWKPKVLNILGGMLYCWFFLLWLSVHFFSNSCFVFFLGFCDTTLLIPLVDFDGCLRGSVPRSSSSGSPALPCWHRPCFWTFFKKNLLIQLLFVFQQT